MGSFFPDLALSDFPVFPFIPRIFFHRFIDFFLLSPRSTKSLRMRAFSLHLFCTFFIDFLKNVFFSLKKFENCCKLILYRSPFLSGFLVVSVLRKLHVFVGNRAGFIRLHGVFWWFFQKFICVSKKFNLIWWDSSELCFLCKVKKIGLIFWFLKIFRFVGLR